MVHLLEIIIFIKKIEVELESFSEDMEEDSMHESKLIQAITDFRFRMEQIMTNNSKSISDKSTFEFIKQNQHNLKEMDLLSNDKILKFLLSPIFSTEDEKHIKFTQNKREHRKTVNLVLKNNLSENPMIRPKFNFNLDLDPEDEKALESISKRLDTTDTIKEEKQSEMSDKSIKSEEAVKEEKGQLMSILTKSIAKKFLPSNLKKPSLTSIKEENNAEMKEAEIQTENGRSRMMLETLLPIQIESQKSLFNISEGKFSRNNHGEDNRPKISNARSEHLKPYKPNDIKLVTSHNSKLAYPNQYSMVGFKKFDSLSSFDCKFHD